MANKNGLQDIDLTDVDLDEIGVEILVIAKNPNGLTQACSFLSKRGWPATVTSNLPKAIEFVADKKPDFVFISLNHPNPAMAKLPELLSSSFGCVCVAFLETVNPSTQQRLLKTKIKHKVNGPPSGPNLHRTVRRVLAEMFNITEDDRAVPDEPSRPDLIIAKSGKKPAISGDTEIVSTGKYTMTNKSKRKNLKDFKRPSVSEPPPEALQAFLKDSAPAQAPAPAPEVSPADIAAQLKKSLLGDEGDPAPIRMFQTLMERAIQQAMQRICQSTSTTPVPVEQVNHVGVFPVDSPIMPGYLVMVWPNQYEHEGENFIKQAQEALQTVFKEMGVQGRVEPGFFVPVPTVDFATWAMDKAKFSFSTAHGDYELGLAFFSLAKPLPKARPHEDKSMFSIGLDDISTKQPVNFKAYLHLAANNKFFLYLRNGRQLQPEQKARLKGHAVKDLFMKSVDVENLRMYLAACYLSDTIKGSDDDAA